jgi:DNA polymerase delta subunit 1
MEGYHRKPVDFDTNFPLKFQPIEWFVSDETIEEGEPEEFIIRAFGATEDGNSVCCSIRNFNPFFYIKVPAYWTLAHFRESLQKLNNMESKGKKLINYYVKKTLLITECKIENWIPYYGFCNMENSRFVKMVFSSQRGMKGYLYAIKSLKGTKGLDMFRSNKNSEEEILYDTNMDTLLKFFHNNKIQPSNHITVNKYYKDDSSRCQINVECDYKKVEPCIEAYNNPFLQASYDIETYSTPAVKNDKEYYPFPVPEKKENPIYQIATCFKRFGEENFIVKHIFTLKTCSPIDDDTVIVECCESEKDLLKRWIELITSMDPDIIYSYNGNMFDDNYIWVRCEMLGLTRTLGELSRINDYPAKIKSATFSSSAYGKSEYKRLDIPGVINYDILITIRRDFKENSYKLDSISEKYLGEKKNPVKVEDIFKAYASGDPEKIKTIAMYCVQDTRLPQMLVDKLHILQSQISMSNVTYVSIKMLIERGQEVKAVSQINMTAKKKNFLMPNFDYKENVLGFEGATVLKPEVGLYDVITTVDFEGLYPSIIRAHNLCYTSIVLDDKYLNLEGIEYTRVKFSEDEPEAIFVQNTETILPSLLVELYNERKKYKKLMKEAKTEALKAIYDRTQQAVKISANSIYGVLGSKTVGCREIAASVTHFGRQMIKDTKKYIETHHHSVFPENHESNILDEDEEVVIKDDKGQRTVKVKELDNIKNCFIKTNNGWRKIKNIESY